MNTDAASQTGEPISVSQEFDRLFPNEEACLAFLARLRWPEGFVCPNCGPVPGWSKTRGRLVCSNCRREMVVSAGTIFEGTHKSLRTWFAAVWRVANEPHGTSVKEFQRILRLGSYKTAWTWMRRLHMAMAPRAADLLRGPIEMDDLHIPVGIPVTGKPRVGSSIKLVIAAESGDMEAWRARLARIERLTEKTVVDFAEASLEPGALVRTDQSQAYLGLADAGFYHQVANLPGDAVGARPAFGRTRQVASSLADWMYRARAPALHSRSLDLYLDEFTFRFNQRTVSEAVDRFYLLMKQVAGNDAPSAEKSSPPARGAHQSPHTTSIVGRPKAFQSSTSEDTKYLPLW